MKIDENKTDINLDSFLKDVKKPVQVTTSGQAVKLDGAYSVENLVQIISAMKFTQHHGPSNQRAHKWI